MTGELIRTADWKTEKHVPAIDCAERVRANEPFLVTVSVGREIPHPNEPGHHIMWIALHYVPDGAAASIELARCDFSAHGAGTGVSSGPARTNPTLTTSVALGLPGRLVATAYCNLHGLWASEIPIRVE